MLIMEQLEKWYIANVRKKNNDQKWHNLDKIGVDKSFMILTGE